MARRTILESDKSKALELIKGGMETADVVKQTGISRSTVDLWRLEMKKASPLPTTGGADSSKGSTSDTIMGGIKPPSLPPAPKPTAPTTASPSESPLQAALRAAGLKDPAKPPVTPSGVPPSAPAGTPAPAGFIRVGDKLVSEGEALLELTDFAVGMSVRVYAGINKVELTPDLQRLIPMTADERKQLSFVAPYAAPYVKKLLENLPIIGAVCYGGAVVMVAAGRFSAVKARKPKPAPKPEESKEKKK